MMVRFLETCIPLDKSGRVYEKDSIHDLTGDAARHWLSRGKAEFVLEPKPVKTIGEAKAEPPPAPEPVPALEPAPEPKPAKPEVREIDGERAVTAFKTGQHKYRRKKLADKEDD